MCRQQEEEEEEEEGRKEGEKNIHRNGCTVLPIVQTRLLFLVPKGGKRGGAIKLALD